MARICSGSHLTLPTWGVPGAVGHGLAGKERERLGCATRNRVAGDGLGRVGKKTWSRLAFEVIDDRSFDELKHRTALLSTSGHHGPDALAPVLPGFAAGALGHASMDHHEADGVFRHVVGRIDGTVGYEGHKGPARLS